MMRFTINLKTIMAFTLASCLAYYFLLCKNFLHTSITEIIFYSHSLALTKHILVLGLLPVYIAAILLGVTIVGVFLVNLLQRLLLPISKI